MRSNWLEDEDGFPRTATVHFGWIIVIVAFTCGIAAILLQLYLCLWVLKKSRAVRPLAAFFVMMILEVAGLTVRPLLPRWASITFGLLWAVSSIVAALLLRTEVRASFRKTQGWEPAIYPIAAAILSATYINLCLIPSTPYDSPAMASPLTSLNLSSVSTSAKIAT